MAHEVWRRYAQLSWEQANTHSPGMRCLTNKVKCEDNDDMKWWCTFACILHISYTLLYDDKSADSPWHDDACDDGEHTMMHNDACYDVIHYDKHSRHEICIVKSNAWLKFVFDTCIHEGMRVWFWTWLDIPYTHSIQVYASKQTIREGVQSKVTEFGVFFTVYTVLLDIGWGLLVLVVLLQVWEY